MCATFFILIQCVVLGVWFVKRFLLGIGLLLLLIPLILIALYSVEIPVLRGSMGRGVGHTVMAYGARNVTTIVTFLDSIVLPLPSKSLFDELGISRIRLVISTSNQSKIFIYLVPIRILGKFINTSVLTSMSQGFVQNLECTPLRFLLKAGYAKGVELSLSNEFRIANMIAKQLEKFKLIESENQVTLVVNRSWGGNALIVYAPTTDTIDIDITVYVRLVKHLDMYVCIVAMVLGAASMSIGILLSLRSWRSVRNLFR